MAADSLVVAVLLGVVQGVLEWLPISSEGNLALALTLLGASPGAAVRYALFLHLGTAASATAYYRRDLLALANRLPGWRPRRANSPDQREVTFLALATLVSGAVGIGAYVTVVDRVSALSGGSFVALVGLLLVVTGLVQRLGDDRQAGSPGRTASAGRTWVDAVLVGAGQGLAILPGISRSGTTVGVLLLRGHEGETAFRLSFLLSIPAAVGAASLALVEAGAGFAPSAAVALLVSAAVGYATIGLLVDAVRRVPFWAVCVAIGSLAMAGGVLVGLA